MKLKLYNRDEIFVIDLNHVLYFKAEDHYTLVYYGKETKQLLPFGLSQLESAIQSMDDSAERFVRAGRSHLINFDKIIHASVSKEMVTMLNGGSLVVSIHVSRSVVKDIARNLKGGAPAAENCGGGGKSLCL